MTRGARAPSRPVYGHTRRARERDVFFCPAPIFFCLVACVWSRIGSEMLLVLVLLSSSLSLVAVVFTIKTVPISPSSLNWF